MAKANDTTRPGVINFAKNVSQIHSALDLLANHVLEKEQESSSDVDSPCSTPDTQAPQKPCESIPETLQSDKVRWNHHSLFIRTVLEMEDSDLMSWCQAHPQGVAGIRRALTQQQARGIKYLVPENCDNIGPHGDCQGHCDPDTPDSDSRPVGEDQDPGDVVIDGVLPLTEARSGAETKDQVGTSSDFEMFRDELQWELVDKVRNMNVTLELLAQHVFDARPQADEVTISTIAILRGLSRDCREAAIDLAEPTIMARKFEEWGDKDTRDSIAEIAGGMDHA